LRRSCEECLKDAYSDLKYLLNRGYRKSHALKFVADHYRLSLDDRYLLARCTFPDDWISGVREKLVSSLDGGTLAVDGFNVLITIESVLDGEAIECEDGLLRDVKYQGRYRMSGRTERVIELAVEAITAVRPDEVIFFYGRSVSKSGLIAGITEQMMERERIRGEVRLVRSPDFILKGFDTVATADVGIIEKVRRVVDLPMIVARTRNIKPVSFLKLIEDRPQISP